MKKLTTLIASLLFSVSTFAAYQVDLSIGAFFNADGTLVDEEYCYALIADVNDKGFGSLELLSGDTFTTGSFINSSNDYLTITTGNLAGDDWEDPIPFLASGSITLNNDVLGLEGDEEVAIVVWNSQTSLAEGDNYVVFTPSLVGGDLSEGDAWIIPVSNEDSYSFYGTNTAYYGNLDTSFFTLSKTVAAVPEPSTYAVIFGAIALGFVAYRRRK